MACIRSVLPADRDELAALWSICFDDSPSFVTWFFKERFDPSYSFCLVEDESIVSVIHSWPMALHIRGIVIPALMLCGVSTRPGYEKRGYMHALMSTIMRFSRRNGFPLVFHKPNRIETYHSLGHLPCTRALVHYKRNGPDLPLFSKEWPADELLAIYETATKRYSGCVKRDETAMQLKLADYRIDGAQLLRVDGGYAILSRQDSEWFAEETLAVSETAYRALLDALPGNTSVKLPPDLPFRGNIIPQNVMGAADIPVLLASLCGDPSYVFRIDDPVVPENCGTFNGTGRLSNAPATHFLPAGALMQHLCGFEACPPFTRQICYCVEEY